MKTQPSTRLTKSQTVRISACILMCFAFLITSVALIAVDGVLSNKLKGVRPLDYQADASTLSVVLMIGDGMGFNHLECTKAYYSTDLFMESAVQSGKVQTFSLSYPSVTDSAAAATAMSTGYKATNGEISRRNGADLTTASEYALLHGLAAGVISTETMYGATPAGFSAHASSRSDKDSIFSSQMSSGVHFFGGLNSDDYASKVADFSSSNYVRVSNSVDFSAVPALSGSVPPYTAGAQKIFATYDSFALTPADASATSPTLAQVAVSAMERLDSASQKGYMLMVEEAYIDKHSHSNKIFDMMARVRAFDNAVKAVVSKAEAMGNTLVIVTADHETGGLTYSGESAEAISSSLYKSTSHTGADVPYFIFGNISALPSTIDNTQIRTLISGVVDANAI